MKVAVSVNGARRVADVEARVTLADLLRDVFGLAGTKLGCETGSCGSCTVIVDRQPVVSCLQLAACCEGREITTIEGFGDDALMLELKEVFRAEHAVQCGFCTPGVLVVAHWLISSGRQFDEGALREELRGNLCRCTGYVGIVRAIMAVAGRRSRSTARTVDYRQ